MKLSQALRKEATDVDTTTTTTFNAPGVYIPPYGKTVVTVGGQGAPGNAASGGNAAGTNPSSGGNYAGTYSPVGGNYAYTNPTTPGNYAGTNPGGFYVSSYYTTTDFVYPGYTTNGTQNTVWSYNTVNISGYFNAYGIPYYNIPINYYVVSYASVYQQYSYNNQIVNGVPSPYIQSPNSTTNYASLSYVAGAAYYNPSTPGNAVYNPVSPGYAYYNPTVPGNTNYNPTVPGTAGGDYVLGGVTLSGGAVGTSAPVVSPTPSQLVYNGVSGITITVPTGGYVTVTNKKTNT